MEPVVKTCLAGLVAIYMIAGAHMITVIQNPPQPAWTAQPRLSADANLVRPEIYALR